MTTAELELIAHLEARITALEQRPYTGTEELSPTYLTVTPAGRTGATFSGGVSIPEISSASVPPPLSQSFNFTPPLHGPGVGGLVGYLLAAWDAGTGIHAVTLSGRADTPDYASLSLHSTETGALGASAVIASTADTVGAASRTVVDSAGDSSFVQILSPNVPITQQQSRVSRVTLAGTPPGFAAAGWQTIALDTIEAQPDIPWNSATKLFVVPAAGRYRITGTVNLTNNVGAASALGAGFIINGAIPFNYAYDSAIPNTAQWIRTITDNYPLAANATVGLVGYCSSIAGFGTAINAGCVLSIQLVG